MTICAPQHIALRRGHQGGDQKQNKTTMTQAPHVIRMTQAGPSGPQLHLTELTLGAADFTSALPTQHGHVYYSNPQRGLTVGVWDSTAMQETFGPYPGDEFIVVLGGACSLTDADGAAVDVKQHQMAAIRSGAPLCWKQDGYLRKFYLKLSDPTGTKLSSEAGVVVIDPDTALTDADALPPVQRGDALEREREFFTNDAGTMTVGLWDSRATPGEMGPFFCHEFVVVVEGEVIISELGGISQTFRAGDAFFVPKGTQCAWHIPSYIRKFYVGVDAA